MNTTTIIVIAVIVVIALAILFLVRGRKQHVTFDAAPPLRPIAPKPNVVAEPVIAPAGEGHSVATEIADAVEDVVDQFIGIDSHPHAEAAKGPGDTLTQLKGL